MRRKIISHGPSSLTISLPSNWVKANNLQKGDEIDIFEEDNGLVVKPTDTNNEIKRTQIEIGTIGENTWKDMLMILHSQGYDQIKVNFDAEETVKRIHGFLNEEQLGFEVIEQNNNGITLRNISNPQCDQFPHLFRRIFRMTNEYARKIESIMTDTNNSTESRLLYQTTISRLANYCKRIVITENKKTSTFYCSMINNINNINQQFTDILKQLREEQDIDEETQKLFSETIESITSVYNLYYKFTIEDYERIKEGIEQIENRIRKTQIMRTELNSIKESTKRLLPSILGLQFQ